MSVLLFTGLPGSGKSYGVVKNVIVPCLKKGRTIITNIPLNAERIGEEIGAGSIIPFKDSMFDADDIHEEYPGAVWVLDEVWRWWPAGLTGTKQPKNQAEFFRMHRHSVGDDGKTAEIVLITQDESDIAKCVRVVVERNYHAVKLSHMGSSNRCRVDIFRFDQGDRKELVRNIFDKYEKPYTDFYQSHTKIASESDIEQGEEVSVDNRGSVWKRPAVRLAIFFLVVVLPTAIYFGVVSFSKVLHTDDDSLDSASTPSEPVRSQPARAAEPARSEPASTQVAQDQPAEEPLTIDNADTSDYWRFIGSYDGARGRYWLIQSNDQRVRQLPADDCSVIPSTSQHVCFVDGKAVTEWTGRRVSVSAALTGSNPL